MEYAGEISLVLFFEGCSERCSFCFNPELFNQETKVTLEMIDQLFKDNMPYITAIVITGGEPMEQVDDVIKVIKLAKEYGLKVKLNTNGVWPCHISKVIDLVDAVRLDYKPWKEQKMRRSIEVIGDKLEIAYAFKEGTNEYQTVDGGHSN
jgi:pyruvate formate lyase activating enzyme